MKGIQRSYKKYQADRRRQARMDKFITPVADVAATVTQLNGALFGSTGTVKARQATMGVSRIFETRQQQNDADTLETVILGITVGVSAAKAVVKASAKVQQYMAERSYAKAAEQAEPTVHTGPTKKAAPTKRGPYKTRSATFSTTTADVEV